MMDQTKSPMSGLSLDKKSLLQPICKGTNEIAATIALDYYSTDPKEKKAIVAQLVQYGITIEMIEAKAMQRWRRPLDVRPHDRQPGNQSSPSAQGTGTALGVPE
jgi:hypothetical protein